MEPGTALQALTENTFSQRAQVVMPETDLLQIVVAVEPSVLDMFGTKLNSGCGRATKKIGAVELLRLPFEIVNHENGDDFEIGEACLLSHFSPQPVIPSFPFLQTATRELPDPFGTTKSQNLPAPIEDDRLLDDLHENMMRHGIKIHRF